MRQAFEYYEAKKADLGFEFVYAVRETVNRIEENPLQFPVKVEGIRRASVDKFPYGIWYVVEPDQSVVIAALHAKQDASFALRRSRILEP